MSRVLIDVLPCRGVKLVKWGGLRSDILLSSPGGEALVLRPPGQIDSWVVLDGKRIVATMGTLEQCLWLIIGAYGKGACDWVALHGRLFGGQS